MTSITLGSLATRGMEVVLVTFALVGLAAMVVFVTDGELSDAVLPTAVVAAVVAQWWRRPVVALEPCQSADRPWLLGGLLLVLAAAMIVAWGALATPSRTWDGAAMWDVKAALLAERPTLAQPAFRDPEILLHSRDYPLLQPVLMATLERWLGTGRVLFPLLFLTHCALLFAVLRRAGVALRIATAMAVAFAVTPMILTPSGGGADSGYAEPLLALAVTAAVGGLVVEDRLLVAVGVALLVWAKPEGGLYGAVVVALAWLRDGRGPTFVASASWCGAMAIWLVVQRDLQSFGRATFAWSMPFALAVLFVGIVGSHRFVPNARTRGWLILAVAAVGALALPSLARLFEVGSGVFAGYLQDPARVGERLAQAPEILAGIVNWAWLRGRFGLAFVAVLVVAVRLRSVVTGDPLRWLAAMIGVVALPFLLTPFDDLDGHIRASMPRLLSHHLGVAWLAIGLGLGLGRQPDAIAPVPRPGHSM